MCSNHPSMVAIHFFWPCMCDFVSVNVQQWTVLHLQPMHLCRCGDMFCHCRVRIFVRFDFESVLCNSWPVEQRNAAEKIQVALASFPSGDTALSANTPPVGRPWILHLGCCYIQGSQRSKPLKLSQCCPRLRSTHRTSRKFLLWGYTHKRSWIFTDVIIVVNCNDLTGTVEWCFVGIPRFSTWRWVHRGAKEHLIATMVLLSAIAFFSLLGCLHGALVALGHSLELLSLCKWWWFMVFFYGD